MSLFRSIVIVWILLLAGSSYAEQQSEIPSELSELVSLAQRVRTLLAEGQMLEVIEFIVPEKRNQVLVAGRPQFRNPVVQGVDLTEDPSRVIVRFSVDMPNVELGANRSWPMEDPWVRVDDRWLFDPSDYTRAGLLGESGPDEPARDPEEVRAEFEDVFTLVEDLIEVGTMNEGDRQSFSIPVQYSGDSPLRIRTSIPSDFLTLDAATTLAVLPSATSFKVWVNSEGWEGPFRFPVPLTIEYEGLLIERTVTFTGEVFVPLTFRAINIEGADPDDLHFSLQNNTEESVHINYVTVDGKLWVEGFDELIEPTQQGTIHLRRKPDVDPPDEVTIVLSQPVLGRQRYSFPFDFNAL